MMAIHTWAALMLIALLLPCRSSAQIINEIMFDPLDVDGDNGAEYVELLNADSAAIDIGGWKLYDAGRTPQITLPSNLSILPNGYLLIACDSSIYSRFPWLKDSTNVVLANRSSLSLNSGSDQVRLCDRAGSTVDSVAYSESWHWRELDDAHGISLERISANAPSNDRHNWSSSVATPGGTPGAINSRSITPGTSESLLSTTPRTISPDGDGFEDFIRIGYRLPLIAAHIVITIFDRRGQPVCTIAENEPTGDTGERIWNGTDNHGIPLRPGLYIVRLEAYGDEGSVGANTVVIVARRW